MQTITCPQLFTGEPGRPKFEITEEILRFLFDKRFTVSETATLLGVSKRTVERRMNEFGVRIGECYSYIADNLINLWFPSICHNANGLGTWYLRLRTGRRDRARTKSHEDVPSALFRGFCFVGFVIP